MESERLSKGRENFIIALLFVACGSVMATRFGITNSFAYMKDVTVTPVEMGLIMSVHSIAWGISSLILGFLSDFVQKQRFFMIGCLVVSSVLGLAIGFAPSIETIIILRALIGVFQGPLLPLVQSAARMSSSPSRVGLNLGLVIAGGSLLGRSLPSAVVPSLSAQSNSAWRAPMIGIGAIGIVVGVFLLIFYKENKQASSSIKTRTKKVSVADIKDLLKNRNFLLGVFGAVGAIGWTLCLSTYAAAYLETETTATTAQLSLILSSSALAGMASNIVLPSLSDKIGRKPSYILCGIGLVLAPLILVLFRDNMGIVLPVVFYGVGHLVGNCGMSLNTYVIVGESVPTHLITTAYSICLCAGELLGGTAGPAIAGAVANQHGLSSAMYITSLFGALCLFCALLIKETLATKNGTASVK